MPDDILRASGGPRIEWANDDASVPAVQIIVLPLPDYNAHMQAEYRDATYYNRRRGGTRRMVGSPKNVRVYRFGYRFLPDEAAETLIEILAGRVVLFTPRTVATGDASDASLDVETVRCRVESDIDFTRHITGGYRIELRLTELLDDAPVGEDLFPPPNFGSRVGSFTRVPTPLPEPPPIGGDASAPPVTGECVFTSVGTAIMPIGGTEVTVRPEPAAPFPLGSSSVFTSIIATIQGGASNNIGEIGIIYVDGYRFKIVSLTGAATANTSIFWTLTQRLKTEECNPCFKLNTWYSITCFNAGPLDITFQEKNWCPNPARVGDSYYILRADYPNQGGAMPLLRYDLPYYSLAAGSRVGGTWTQVASLVRDNAPAAIYTQPVVTAHQGEVWVLTLDLFDGFNSGGCLYKYTPSTNSWSFVTWFPAHPLDSPVPAQLSYPAFWSDGTSLWAAGGTNAQDPDGFVNELYQYNGTFTLHGALPYKFYAPGSVYFTGGADRAYIFGGIAPGGGYLASVLKYAGAWSTVAAMTEARAHIASAICNGRVMLFGGRNAGLLWKKDFRDYSEFSGENVTGPAQIPSSMLATGPQHGWLIGAVHSAALKPDSQPSTGEILYRVGGKDGGVSHHSWVPYLNERPVNPDTGKVAV